MVLEIATSRIGEHGFAVVIDFDRWVVSRCLERGDRNEYRRALADGKS